MDKDIKQTVVNHDDWFKPVNEIAGCRFLKWNRERFSFSVSYDAEIVRRLQGSAFLQQRLWGPAAIAYKEMISAIAVDAKVADNRIKALFKAFDADQDWPRFYKAARAEREAFSAIVLATQKITIAKMKGEIDRIWQAKTRHDRSLQPFRMRVLIENDVRANSVSLQVSDLNIAPAGALTDWQNALKDTARPCFDLGQHGRGLDAYFVEIIRELEVLRGIIEAGRRSMPQAENRPTLLITLLGHAGVGRVQLVNKKLRNFKSRIVGLHESIASAKVRMMDAGQFAARALIANPEVNVAAVLSASQNALDALHSRIGDIEARVAQFADFECMARKAIEEIVNASNVAGTDNAIRVIEETLEDGASVSGSGGDDWENAGRSASDLIAYAVRAGHLHSEIAPQVEPLLETPRETVDLTR